MLLALIVAGLAACAHAHDDHDAGDAWQEKYGPTVDLSFSGITTFGRLPHHRCLDDRSKAFDVAILGMPFDTAVSYRELSFLLAVRLADR